MTINNGWHYAQLGKMTLNIHEVFTIAEIPCILCRGLESPKLEENRHMNEMSSK